MFCDVRGFTALFEKLEPEVAFNFIESFLNLLAELVVLEGGTLNNFTGDGFLAQFEGDSASSTSAWRAVNCGIRIRKRVQDLNLERHRNALPTLSVGVGIHSGLVASGKVCIAGLSLQLLVGDTVNFASRIESLTKTFSVDMLLSETSYLRIKDHFSLLPMPEKEARGRRSVAKTYWVMPHAVLKHAYPS